MKPISFVNCKTLVLLLNISTRLLICLLKRSQLSFSQRQIGFVNKTKSVNFVVFVLENYRNDQHFTSSHGHLGSPNAL